VLEDGAVASEELRGRPYVLNFWASWCVPCREEAPFLQETWRRARERGDVLLVGLNMQDLTEDARDFLRDFDIDYLNIRDPANEVARRFGVTGVPETFFISAEGDVVGHVIGVVSAEQLRAGMRAALGGRPTPTREGGGRRPTR
jgi:cytochrome c biogenesis protein CcmG/thiol:disulfide interchange protein DsbE